MKSDKKSLPGSGGSRYFMLACGIFLLVLIVASCGGQTPDKGAPSGRAPEKVTDQDSADSRENINGTAVSLEESAGECGQCHAMAPEIATFQLSSHNKFECTVCHDVKASRYKDATPTLPITIKAAVAADTCKQCHSTNRSYSPSGDLFVPHDRHDKAGIACSVCHSGVAHANIAEREITTQEGFNDLSKWTIKTAEKVVTKYYTQPSMWTCISCHKKLGITRDCSACHTEIGGLPSHESGSWLRIHGSTGRQDIGECTKCHSIPGEQKFITPSTGDKAADFARANKFCYSCHTIKPEYHGNDMLSKHPDLAIKRGRDNCWTCHNKDKPKPTENVTATFCNQCHWFNAEPVMEESKTSEAQKESSEEGNEASSST